MRIMIGSGPRRPGADERDRADPAKDRCLVGAPVAHEREAGADPLVALIPPFERT